MRMMVGIDPGVETGFCVWDRQDQRLMEVKSVGICAAMGQVQTMMQNGTLHSVTFEDARLRTGWFGGNSAARAQGAGSIKRDCSIWVEFLGGLLIPYKSVSPKSKGAKLNQQQFAKLSGWPYATNEHGRDAAMLVLGARA